MSGFISKPSSGWIHADNVISRHGATYSVKYIGCLEVKVSMRELDFKTRSSVAKLCISQVCEAAGFKTVDKKRRVDRKVLSAIAEVPRMSYAGTNVSLNISSTSLTLTELPTGAIIASHDMPKISFASGGDSDTMEFVAYIAKDTNDWRACYVLECGGGFAKDVISTIGQAFELRYNQFVKSPPLQNNLSLESDTDKDYYNDLPGKVPPECSPPPVPPLPSVVHPFTTLPAVPSPNLIDLNYTDSSLHEMSSRREYVNDSVLLSRDRDVFDMQPFTHHSSLPSGELHATQAKELQNENWYHGQISRAEAERRLLKDGDFLVRESPNTEGQYVLSGMQDSTKKHLLLIDPEGVVRTKDRMFHSVSHLINYHSANLLPIISAESALVLRSPVVAPHNT